jgi:hypothetical protein
MPSPAEQLDRLINPLSTSTEQPRDAIDEVLAGAPRTTQVKSLRDHPDVQQFRLDLIDGLIRIDTANRLLQLVTTVVASMMSR